jgi:hypothetical protein
LNFDVGLRKAIKMEENSPNNIGGIRASALPFCPVKYIFEACEPYSTSSYAMDFYMGIGTTIHQAVQDWYPYAAKKQFFGNWKCYPCKKTVYHKVGPGKCPVCNKDMSYKELKIRVPDAPIEGYIDGIIIEPKFLKRSYSGFYDIKRAVAGNVVELKSAGNFVAPKKVEPSRNHRYQSMFYTIACRKLLLKHNINITGYIVKYLSRDNPYTVSPDLTEFNLKKCNSFYNFTCRTARSFIRSIKNNKPKIINKLYCNNKIFDTNVDYEKCPYLSICKDITLKTFTESFNIARPKIIKKLLYRTLETFKDV